MTGADYSGELLLEGVDVRPQRCNPVGGKGVLDLVCFQAGHVWRGKVDALH